MSNLISIPPNGGGAFPANIVDSPSPRGGTALPVYLYVGYPPDRDTITGAPVNVFLITDADLASGDYTLASNPLAVPMYTGSSEQPSGNTPIPIYVVG